MTKAPLVSVIIPTYNRAHLIGETLDSVLAQTYTNWECIIVDDGSADNTDDIINNYINTDIRFQFHYRPKSRQKGANACRNYGFQVSKGTFVMFLDSDDLLKNSCIANRISFLLERNLDFVIGDTAVLEEGRKTEKLMCKPLQIENKQNYLLAFLSYQVPWTIMSVLWKREIIAKFSFDETLKRFQDIDFHLKILMYGEYNFLKCNCIDNYYRIEQISKGRDLHFQQIVIDSLFQLMEKLMPEIKKHDIYKKSFKRFFYFISREYIFYRVSNRDRNFKEIFKKAWIYKFFNLMDYFIYMTYYCYTRLNFMNKKGMGNYTFRKFTNKYYAVKVF
jgi:glycosyltransferase involved in cell wall biosynthesis